MDRLDIVAEMREADADFRVLVDNATSAELRRGSDGTKWTNEQLLFHMLFGYLVVRRLLPLVRILGRLPDGVSRRFAALLNAGTGPFHVVNYVGSLGGGRVLGHAGMERTFDRVVTAWPLRSWMRARPSAPGACTSPPGGTRTSGIT